MQRRPRSDFATDDREIGPARAADGGARRERCLSCAPLAPTHPLARPAAAAHPRRTAPPLRVGRAADRTPAGAGHPAQSCSSRAGSAVVQLLKDMGWKQLPAKSIDTLGALPFKHFSHKTRFATKSVTPQEVDLALGFKGTVVLAIECKVSNDGTNSIKRVNDVIKKAAAWKDYWGNFVKTAAVLQGVIAPRDVNRLLDQEVEVFWSHDLAAFEAWLVSQGQV
ncbi:XamI family restriction endonuclease [Ramlibacter sp. AN1015]|uniref:XamI family restriction endonuclease n=1 Tax=Ramlibacter sp. AN1015 TaxID=3133428 RepID=UPI0030BEF61F